MSGDKKQGDLNLSDLGSALPSNIAGLSAENRVGFVNALKNKLQSLARQHADVMETLSPKVKKRVEVLLEIQDHHDDLEAKFHKERAALEAKYQKLYEPLYTKRYKIVNGLVEVEGVVGDSTDNVAAEHKSNAENGVPNFWLTSMKTNEVLAGEIHERDDGSAAAGFLPPTLCLKLKLPTSTIGYCKLLPLAGASSSVSSTTNHCTNRHQGLRD